MLNFIDPISVDDLTVLRDDENANTFYVLPNQPVVPVGEDGTPEFLFILYTKDLSDVPVTDETGGGYLQFRTVLSLTDAQRARVVDATTALLASEKAAGKKPFGNEISDGGPNLATPLWTAGTVDLATFAVSDTGLVRQATSQAPVDLTGQLGAAFAATLSTDGAGVFEGAFKAYQDGTHQLPLVVTYHLTYVGRINARLTIDASHSVVHERVWRSAAPYRLLTDGFLRYVPLALDTPFTVGMLPALRHEYGIVHAMLPRPAIATAVEQTISDASVTVKIEEVSTGDAAADAATRASLLKLATDLLTDSLLPSLTAGGPQPGATDAGSQTAQTTLLQLDENAEPGTATFHLELDDAISITREAAPNAPLQVLIDDPSALASCFHALRLADDFFTDMRVTFSTSGVDFSADGIAKIHVYYRYSQTDDAAPGKPLVERHDDAELDSATAQADFRFDTARTAGGGHKEDYQYMAEVYWQRGGAPTVVPWTTTNRRLVIITPPQLGAVKVDAVLTAPPGSVDSARVDVAYTAADHTTYTGGLELTPAAPRATWLQSTGEIVPADRAGSPRPYDYTVTYRVGPTAIVVPQRSSTQETVEVPTPFAGSVTFTLMAGADWSRVSSIAGTATYADERNGYTRVAPFTLTGATPSTDVTVPVMPGGARSASCTGRVQNADGSHEEFTATLAEGLNFVGGSGIAPLTVTLRTDVLDLVNDLKAVHVSLTFGHADGSVTSGEHVFTATEPAAWVWTVPRQGADGGSYGGTVTFYGTDRSTDRTVTLTGYTDTTVELDRSMPTTQG
ncbi:hypothetical protein [Cellulomonas alba]|uniref:Ig-like domain-containing protein n=1 Tax=Cellulomonas alba TaxID=3053467 RepID=A0ABT7SBA8_9CELL|nr:hypothetical protein [Cellulomonas alba]MDM7853463.1 hypothetical protein [Cellulomonas alba]